MKKGLSLFFSLLLFPSLLLSGCSEPTKPPKEPYQLGNVVILGASMCTFEGYIPKGNSCWYWTEPKNETDVTKVEQTWWHILLEETGSTLVLNESWSGSPVCNTGYNGDDATSFSFITRLDKLIEANFFEENDVDTLIIFGAQNDSWSGAPLGEVIYDDWGKPEKKLVLPAISYMISRCVENNIRPLVLINTGLKKAIVNGFKEVCTTYAVDYIELQSYSQKGGHPDIAGMRSIADQIEAFIASK